MSAVLTRHRPSRPPEREAGRIVAPQQTLFGPSGSDVAAVAVEPDVDATTVTSGIAPRPVSRTAGDAPVRRQSLAEAMSDLWDGLAAGEVAGCPVCGAGEMRSRHSAGAGVVGGRCGGCGTTLA